MSANERIDEIAHEAVEKEEKNEGGQKLLNFFVNGRLYAVSIENVSEIIGIQDITLVPHSPDYVKGVTNIRGKVIPLVELRARFGNPSVEYDDRTCIIIIEQDELVIGYIIDEISDVFTMSPTDVIETAPESEEASRFIKGMIRTANGVALILDIDKVAGIDDGDDDIIQI